MAISTPLYLEKLLILLLLSLLDNFHLLFSISEHFCLRCHLVPNHSLLPHLVILVLVLGHELSLDRLVVHLCQLVLHLPLSVLGIAQGSETVLNVLPLLLFF